MTAGTQALDLSGLTPKQFEELVYDVLEKAGFRNLQWRDGGADGGRDVTGSVLEEDASGYEEYHNWFCQAKLYRAGISFDAIHPVLSKASAHEVDYLLLAVWPHLTPQCKDQLEGWKRTSSPRFRVRLWEKKDIEKRLKEHPSVLQKYLPDAWSKRLEMDAYLRQATASFREFQGRVSTIWKNPDARPLLDLLRIVPKNGNVPAVNSIDESQHLTHSERAFVIALADAHRSLEELMKKALNIQERTVFLHVRWKGRHDVRVIVPVPHTNILCSDMTEGLGSVVGLFARAQEAGHVKGILTGASSWKPYSERDRVTVYAVFPDTASCSDET